MPKQDDNESVVSALSEAMVTLTEHTIAKHLHSNDDGTVFKVSPNTNSVSPSIEIISPKRLNVDAKSGIADDDDDIDSLATTGTSGTIGSKRKRVRHRKKKKNSTENDENQMNKPNIEQQAIGSILKGKEGNAKQTNKKPTCNTHVR